MHAYARLVFKDNANTGALGPIYSLLANIKIAHASTAPKVILPDSRVYCYGDSVAVI